MNIKQKTTINSKAALTGSFFIIFNSVMQRLIILLLLCCCTAYGQSKPLKGFAEAGYQHEAWTIARKTGNLYSSVHYAGNGYYLGGGVRSRLDTAHRIGYSISADYVQFNMADGLSVNERAQTNFAFARLSPSFCYRFPVRRSNLTFTGLAGLSVLAALRDNERTYFQYGLKGAVGYKAYEAVIGFNFSQGKKPPTADVTGKWREQTFMLGVVCYPAMLKAYKAHK